MPVIMGTAGHIDHGKTSLVRVLTGIDCDRLEEEKRRGITIELGFAHFDLPDGTRLGIVDVPGHERFVKNMVAGAAGIDFVTLVIAADEGVMPQTREHLEICSLLGIHKGLVALTKIDMVDADWLELVTEDVKTFLKGTFLEGAPIMPVSSQTGEGLDALKDVIGNVVREHAEKRRSDLFRLPVDRIFTMKGHGTVVTGTCVSGVVAVGDELLLYPGARPTRVRNLQSHHAASAKSLAGTRTALNLYDLEVEDVTRGDVLARPGTLFPWTVWDVELKLLASSPQSLKHRKQVHFHHGAREVMARVYFLDREELKAGETAVCQVRFEEPMVGVYGDRVVLRSFSPLRTIGGGRLVNPLGRKVKRFSDEVKRLYALAEGGAENLVRTQLAMAGGEGLSFNELVILTDLETKALDKLLQDLGGKQLALQFDREAKAYVAGELVESLSEGLLAFLAAFHKKEPLKLGAARGQLASTWGKALKPKLFHFIVERLIRKGQIVADQEFLRLPTHKVSLASDVAKLRGSILKAYEDGGITPPNLKDVLDPLGVEFKEAAAVFKLLQEEGRLVKIKEDMYFATPAMDRLKELVTGFFASAEEMGPVEYKELTGHSRKFAIPVLEYLDKEKVTIRVGDKRRLRRK